MIDRARTPSMDVDGEFVRIGAVSYLNSKPLIEGLAELVPRARLILDLPSRLADRLASSELDVALIPSVEAVLDPDYEVVSDACVAARGPVLSVKLYSRVHPGMIRTLALDEGSRTSSALVRIMLAERFGVLPDLQPLPLQLPPRDVQTDALLMIGDRAIPTPSETFHTVWDLGEEWSNWTGLPFVFAMWVTRRGSNLGRVAPALERARDYGVQHIPDIAVREAPQLSLSREVALSYLSRNLHFRLGSAELSGLRLFYDLAARQGFVPPDSSLRSRPSSDRASEPRRAVARVGS